MQYGYQGIRYDGTDLAPYLNIYDLKMAPVPPISVSSTDVPGRAGALYHTRNIGPRTMTFSASLETHDRSYLRQVQFWRHVVKLLLKDDPKPLYLDESRYINAILTDVSEIERVGTRANVSFTMTAYDPYFYGVEQTFALSSGNNSFWSYSTEDVWPVIEVTGASSPLAVINTTTGHRVTIPTVSSSSTYVIDMANQRVTLSGNYVSVNMQVTDFWRIRPGENVIQLSSGRGTMRYREVSL